MTHCKYYSSLLHLCDREEEDEVKNVSPLWTDLSNDQKGEEHHILEMMALKYWAHTHFIIGVVVDICVTTDLATKVKQLAFIAPKPSDLLDLGINICSLPFMSS